MNAVIMAGGRGLRLHPITEKIPKPLIRVGSKPLLETIIDGFAKQGFDRFFLCVHYKAELIEEYFGDGSDKGIHIEYIREKTPLGTAGGLSLLPLSNSPMIVSNADVIAEIDYLHLLSTHEESGKDATVCLGLHQYQVPFGVVSVKNDKVTIREKPIENFEVNAGIYVLPGDISARIKNVPIDTPDLLDQLTVNPYPILGYWQDVGHFDSLAKAHIEWSMRAVA